MPPTFLLAAVSGNLLHLPSAMQKKDVREKQYDKAKEVLFSLSLPFFWPERLADFEWTLGNMLETRLQNILDPNVCVSASARAEFLEREVISTEINPGDSRRTGTAEN